MTTEFCFNSTLVEEFTIIQFSIILIRHIILTNQLTYFYKIKQYSIYCTLLGHFLYNHWKLNAHWIMQNLSLKNRQFLNFSQKKKLIGTKAIRYDNNNKDKKCNKCGKQIITHKITSVNCMMTSWNIILADFGLQQRVTLAV